MLVHWCTGTCTSCECQLSQCKVVWRTLLWAVCHNSMWLYDLFSLAITQNRSLYIWDLRFLSLPFVTVLFVVEILSYGALMRILSGFHVPNYLIPSQLVKLLSRSTVAGLVSYFCIFWDNIYYIACLSISFSENYSYRNVFKFFW